MIKTIVFDVNETLLDVRTLQPEFEQLFGDAAALPQWFAQLLQSSMAFTLAGKYHNFGQLARHALVMVGKRRQVEVTAAQQDNILAGMSRLRPHVEVPSALETLHRAGFQLIALTNSPPHIVQAQLTNAGLVPLFSHILSVEAVKRFKPAPEPYGYAAAQANLDPTQMWFVAAHDWDVMGAMAVGYRAAFIARPNMVLGPLTPLPEVIASNLMEVSAKIIALSG